MLSLDLSALYRDKTNTGVHSWCYRAKIQHVSCALIFRGLTRGGAVQHNISYKVRLQSTCY